MRDYHYGANDVDVESDGTIDATVKLRYACP
jgi:hypothetical protein